VSLLSSDWGASRDVSSTILRLKFNTRRFSTNIYRWDTCDAWSHYCGRNNIILSSPPLRLQNSRASVENPYCIRCILPQQFRRIVKRCASSGTYRLIRFDLNGLILMGFCFFNYVITADIIKMYRQILVHPWRACREFSGATISLLMSIRTNSLHSPTPSPTASVSFLATRCLKHLAEQLAHQFTRGSACVLRDFYVDDMLTGADIQSTN